MNYMKQIAEMLGIALNEEFEILNLDGLILPDGPYILTNDGLFDVDVLDVSIILVSLLKGVHSIKLGPFKPKDGDTFYYLNPFIENGYSCSVATNDGYHLTLMARDVQLFRTEQEAQNEVINLGWQTLDYFEDVEEYPDYEDMTKRELYELCRKQGLPVNRKMNRDDMIDILDEYDNWEIEDES